MGLWSFDLSHVQIMQISIKEEDRGIVNSTEKAFTTLAYMVILLISVIFNDPKYFEYLMYGSLICVSIACFSFSFWTIRKELVSVVWDEENDEESNEKSNQEIKIIESKPTEFQEINLSKDEDSIHFDDSNVLIEDVSIVDSPKISSEGKSEMDWNDKNLFKLMEETKEELKIEEI